MKLAERDRLAASNDEVKRTIDIVWSAYRSILSKEGRLAYVSMAISSGRRMWNTLFAHGVKTPEELKAKGGDLFRDVIAPNIESGIALGRGIAKETDHPVIVPAIFEAKKQRWSQDEYMAMWLRMIEENVGRVYMAPDWQYSNGGAEEYLHTAKMALGFASRCDILPLTARGDLLPLHVAADMIGEAVLWISSMGGRAPTLVEVYRGLLGLRALWMAPEMSAELPRATNMQFLEASFGFGRDVVTQKECGRLIELDYGLRLHQTSNTATGVPPTKDVLPEGLDLRVEEPPKE